MVPFQRPSYDKLTKDGCLCVLHIIHILETHREGFRLIFTNVPPTPDSANQQPAWRSRAFLTF